MNILPTDPWRSGTTEEIERYFEDLRRWNFDIPYSAFYAFPHETLIGEAKEKYKAFADRARAERLPACVQIQSTVGYLDTPDLIEAGQYHLDNTPIVYEHYHGKGAKNFFGSFASERWFEYVMNVARTLREYGYDWVVFEEPMYRVDIPGTKDAFYKLFRERYPELEYPTRRDESLSYLTLQALKMDVLVDFYRRCCLEAKRMGYSKVGIMPWFFTPTYENTPMESWATCCDLGRLTFLDDLDFIVVRMQPDNVWAEAMVSSGGESLPRLAYLENLSQALGKPTIAVNNPTNEHVSHSQEGTKDLLDYGYFTRYTLAALAAAPSGMSRHWYGKNYDQDERHMDLYTECNPFFGRFGGPVSPFAMVFSHRGTVRVMPRPWLETWRSFSTLLQGVLFEHRLPCLTFFADSLQSCIKRHPEVQTLILTPYFPISRSETALLESWLSDKPGRSVVYVGSDYGYTYDFETSIYHWAARTPPEMISLCGIDPSSYSPLRRDDRISLDFVGKCPGDAFLGESLTVKTSGTAKVAFTDERVQVLYRDRQTETPVIAKREIGNGSHVWYFGLSLDGIEAGESISPACAPFPVISLLRRQTATSEFPLVVDAQPGILWNQTRSGFLVISNTTEEDSSVVLKKANGDYWDCRQECWVGPGCYEIGKLSFSVIRVVPYGSPFLDILNVFSIESIQEIPEKLTIKGCFRQDLCIVSTSPPEKVMLNSVPLDWDVESIEVGWGILPVFDDHCEGLLEVFWSEPRIAELSSEVGNL